MLRTRGKRVVAEATIPDALLQARHARRAASCCSGRAQVANLGGFMAGVNNNGAHSANGITAMFIATGQDVANVAESSAALVYAELAAQRRLLLLGHDPVADRGDLRRRHRAAHPARVPRDARLLRRGQGPQAGRDRRRHGPVRRDLARLGDRRRGVGARRTTCSAATARDRGRLFAREPPADDCRVLCG